MQAGILTRQPFPFLFGGTFIEGELLNQILRKGRSISLPFRRDFH